MLLKIRLAERHFVAILCCLGLTFSYIMRFCLSLAITEMARPAFVKEDPDACPYPDSSTNESRNVTYPYEWTEWKQGVILSSFFWGYVLTQIPGALIAEKRGPKVVLVGGVGLTSVFTLFTPFLLHNWDWTGLIISRIVIGLAQGVVYAALHTIVAYWIPQEERSTWATVVFSANMFRFPCRQYDIYVEYKFNYDKISRKMGCSILYLWVIWNVMVINISFYNVFNTTGSSKTF
ncbi:hypothetical protein O3M35_011310 [Rhynocoris fuscipes]|uniref:Sialin n=1 Tax=Rhynocoris fuscipes TaxID=488301 RepID=A0AAW1CW44_9HEMI